MSELPLLRRLYILALLAVSPGASISIAENVNGVANYAYAVFVGTGKYSIDDRTIYIFRAPLEFAIKSVDYEADQKVGLTLLAPIAVGLTNFEHLEELPDLDVNDLQTMSFVPGLEVPIALNKHWQLKPFAQIGYSVDLKSNDESITWGTGARTRATYGETSRWLIGGEFLRAGNNPRGEQASTNFTRWGIGVEYKITTSLLIFDRELSLHLRALQWRFSDAVEFKEPLLPYKLSSATELGLSFGLSRPISLLGYDFTQLGVGYEWSDDYEAIKFFTTFPF